MRVLILGGTAWLGREIARQAVARGHDVSCAARGSSVPPAGATFVQLDRDRPDAMEPLTGRRWDAVVELSRQPGHVRRAVGALSARHWVFISSGNVYARFDQPEQPEGAPLNEPLAGDVMFDMSVYGPAKVACEQAIGAGTASSTVIRSGLIGGFGDWSGRSGYYPWRFAHPTGPDVLVPPDLTSPVALIDVEDLASWTLDCAQRRVSGTYNATGPTTSLRNVLDLSRRVAGSTAVARPVDAQSLTRHGVGAWMGTPSLPLWVEDAEWRWFATMGTDAARREGLNTRPLEDTLAAALAYEERREVPRATGLSADEERTLRSRLAGQHDGP